MLWSGRRQQPVREIRNLEPDPEHRDLQVAIDVSARTLRELLDPRRGISLPDRLLEGLERAGRGQSGAEGTRGSRELHLRMLVLGSGARVEWRMRGRIDGWWGRGRVVDAGWRFHVSERQLLSCLTLLGRKLEQCSWACRSM